MKYIIFKDQKSGLIQPVLFGEHTTHSQIKLKRAIPVSGGFFSFEKGNMSVYGKSDSLELESKKEDLNYIVKVFLDLGTAFFIPAV